MRQWRLRGITSNGPTDDGGSASRELDAVGALHTVVDQFPGMFWTTDCDLRITSSVGRALRTLGLGPNQLVGMTLAELFEDDIAHSAAVDAHARALAGHGGTLRVVPGPPPRAADAAGLDAGTARRAVAGELDTAWAACTGREASPWNAGTCRASFLDCFHCGNALITRSHLPRLLSLADALEQRRERMSTDAWWRRYGPAWAAIRRHVLPEFSPAEVQAAAAARPADSLLDLAEGLREET